MMNDEWNLVVRVIELQFKLGIDEVDLLEFFNSFHVSREYGTEWFDSDSLYLHDQPNGLRLTCAIFPIHKDVRISLSLNDQTIYDWQVTALADITHNREQNSLCFHTKSGDSVTLRIKPTISVIHNCKYLAE